MPLPDFKQDYFQLFDLPPGFTVDQALLGERYRTLQGELHPDRFAAKPQAEQRLAVQYSALVNEAYTTLRNPLDRALYLMQLEGMDEGEVARQQVDGAFLMLQMELREKLESVGDSTDAEDALDDLIQDITGDLKALRTEFGDVYAQRDLDAAAQCCVKMQYLDKLLLEAQRLESELMDR